MKRFLWIFVFGILFLLTLNNFIFHKYAAEGGIKDLREKLISIASGASRSIDADLLLKIPLLPEGDKTQEYKTVYEELLRIKETNPSIKYVYIMTATEKPGFLQYVIDADPVPEIITAKSPTSFSGDYYDARNLPEMLAAFKGPSADRKFVMDKWGATLSGYAPIYDKNGKAIAILGVDIDAASMYATQTKSQNLLLFVLITGILFSLSFLSLFLKTINS